jgi:hypothetical protein
MKFFVPDTSPKDCQSVYEDINKLLKDQLKTPITDRRIYNLSYRQDKKDWRLQVGELDQREARYQVQAIFESKPYIVVTKGRRGGIGPTILVDADDVTAVEEFDRV